MNYIVGRGLAPAALNITNFCNGGSKPPPYDVCVNKLLDQSQFIIILLTVKSRAKAGWYRLDFLGELRA